MAELTQPLLQSPPPPSPGMTASLDTSSPSSSAPDHNHCDTLSDRHGSHSPSRPTATPSPATAQEARERLARLKRDRSARGTSPESGRSSSSDEAIIAKAPRLRLNEKGAREASTSRSSLPSSPLLSNDKGKAPAADRPSTPPIEVDQDAVSTHSATSEFQSDDYSLGDDFTYDKEEPKPSTPALSAARQREIDAVLSSIPRAIMRPPSPYLEPDTRENMLANNDVDIDEGFCDESPESHYLTFMKELGALRSRRRPFLRMRVPGGQGTTVVQRPFVQRTPRMRRRDPKEPVESEEAAPVAAPDGPSSPQ